MFSEIDKSRNVFSGNTTIGCIITNAKLTKTQCNKLASVSHNALARAISPVHTSADGDTIFVMATGEKEAAPDAKIYVQSVFPVSEAVDKKNNDISLDRIKKYNEKLGELAAERNVNFIDTYSIFADENGFIVESATYDGIYIRPEYYPFWINMLCENSGYRVPK